MKSVKNKVSKQWDMITEGKTVIEAKPMYPSHTAFHFNRNPFQELPMQKDELNYQ